MDVTIGTPLMHLAVPRARLRRRRRCWLSPQLPH